MAISGAGWGSDVILKRAMKRFKEDVKNNDKQVDVVGFSRGSSLALEFTHQVQDYSEKHPRHDTSPRRVPIRLSVSVPSNAIIAVDHLVTGP